MQIQLRFDHEELHRYAQRDAPLVFDIAWEHEGRYYPAPYWNDFGAVILSWWLRAVVELFEGADTADFLWMDGPLGLTGRYEQASGYVQFVPRKGDWEWSIPLNGLAEELVRAATTVERELLAVELGEEDRRSLAYGVARVRETILAGG